MVSDLRRNLFRLRGLRKFAKEDLLMDPLRPLILRDKICSFRYTFVDADPALDSQMLVSASSVGCLGQAEALSLLCEDCLHAYDMATVEVA